MLRGSATTYGRILNAIEIVAQAYLQLHPTEDKALGQHLYRRVNFKKLLKNFSLFPVPIPRKLGFMMKKLRHFSWEKKGL